VAAGCAVDVVGAAVVAVAAEEDVCDELVDADFVVLLAEEDDVFFADVGVALAAAVVAFVGATVFLLGAAAVVGAALALCFVPRPNPAATSAVAPAAAAPVRRVT
jgi:hypothetical protein